MRLIKVPTADKCIKLINADAITDIFIGPNPGDTAYTEVTLTFGEHWIDINYRNITDARQLIADIAGKDLESMKEMLT